MSEVTPVIHHCGSCFFVAAFTSINTIFIILGCAAVGLAVHLVFNTKTERRGKANDFHRIILHIFKIGLFTVGGGYAMLPLIRTEVLSKGWLTAEEIVNFIAVSESTPGPFAVNIATYIGSVRGGQQGSLCNARSCASVVSDYSCDCAML